MAVGTPFTILASDVEFVPINQSGNFQRQFIGSFTLNEVRRDPRNPNGSVSLTRTSFNAGRASGTLYNAGFGRPNVRSLELLKQRSCDDITSAISTHGRTRMIPKALYLQPMVVLEIWGAMYCVDLTSDESI